MLILPSTTLLTKTAGKQAEYNSNNGEVAEYIQTFVEDLTVYLSIQEMIHPSHLEHMMHVEKLPVISYSIALKERSSYNEKK